MREDCKHAWSLIVSERSNVDRKSAYLCLRCGRFRVNVNGEIMTFYLASDEQANAAGIYAKELRAPSLDTCTRCGAALNNVAPGFSIIAGGAAVCTPCLKPGEEIAKAKGAP